MSPPPAASAPVPAAPPHPRGAAGPVRALLLEGVHEGALALLRRAGFEVTCEPDALSAEQLRARLAGVHVLGIRSKTRLPAAALAQAEALVAVGAFCIGVNQVDLAAAHGRGVPVFNAPFSNTRSVAELVIGEIIALARCLGDRSREVHAGVWRKGASGCFEVRNKVLGIVGYGHIGAQVGVLAEMLGMQVVFYDIATKLPLGNNRAVDGLPALLQQADFVTLHVPATPQTEAMLGAEQIALMRQGAYLINISRGSVVDLGALAAALAAGRLRGAAIDVFPEEPQSNGDGFVTPLQRLPNVLLTPHVGGSTEEAQAAIGREVATSLIKFVASGTTSGAVNFPQLDLPLVPHTRRVLHVHHNVPGVLRDVNRVVSELDANIHAQVLATDSSIGYLVMDLDHDVSQEVFAGLSALATSIRTRIL